MDLKSLDPDYERRMLAFEIDCREDREIVEEESLPKTSSPNDTAGGGSSGSANGSGTAWACHSVGEYYSVVRSNHEKAGEIYEKNCSKYGHPPSCFNLGRLYLGGKGVEQSDLNALTRFERACEKGHNMACHHAGLLYLAGKEGGYDVDKDDKKAPLYLEKSCNEGIPESCYFLATHLMKRAQDMYSNSISNESKSKIKNEAKSTPSGSTKGDISKVSEETKTSTSKENEIMNSQAKSNSIGFGNLFSSVTGSFTKKGEKEEETKKVQKELCLTAKKLLETSCEKNSHGQSCYNLAVMYKKGDLPGIPQDLKKFEKYKEMTQEIIKQTGALSWQKGH